MAGLYFEDFVEGATYDHATARSVTAFDNIWISCMTVNTQPLHVNFDFSRKQGLRGKPLMNSMFTLSIVLGQTSADLTRGTMTGTVVLDDIDFPRSVFHDDTLYSRTVVGQLRAGDDPATGIVELLHEGRNQDGELVATCRREVLIRRRPAD